MPNSQDHKQIASLAQTILAKCALKLGGTAKLAKHLGVGEGLLAEWMTGKSVPSAEVIVKAVEPLVNEPASFWSDSGQPQKPAPK